MLRTSSIGLAGARLPLNASLLSRDISRGAAITYTTDIQPLQGRRTQSITATKRQFSGAVAHDANGRPVRSTKPNEGSSLSRLAFAPLVRNILLGLVFTSPTLLKRTLPIIEKIAKSQNAFLNVDRNPLLKAIMKLLIYNHFCAGATEKEIASTRNNIKAMGFSGVVLCFGKEMQLSASKQFIATGLEKSSTTDEINYWRDGNLETLDMTKESDWIGMKLTGSGQGVTNALMKQEKPPHEFLEALDAICARAKERGCKMWIDAEQQAVQAGIDACAIELMRRYNTDKSVLVYNTVQSYLKSSRDKLRHQLQLAHQEGWQLAIKLVRGAYIANDERDKIHDTKEATDESYESIIRDVLQGTNLGFPTEQVPRMQLMIAGHNPESVIGAFELAKELNSQGTLKVRPDFAQLQGMADMLGCNLIQRCEDFGRHDTESELAQVPKVFKCLTWGSMQECFQYLYRRMVENGSASDRIKDGLSAHIVELRRRVIGR